MSSEQRIVEAVHAAVGEEPVVLGGTRAAGGATERSDWDVVVVLSWPRALLSARRLARAARALESILGAPISINPLPRRVLRREPPRLFVWKLRREGRVLWAPPHFALGQPGRFELDAESAFSYAASATVYRLAGESAKAGRHLAQLRQLQAGDYDSVATFGEGDLDGELALALAAAKPPKGGVLVRNLQYVVLSTIRGTPRVRALLSRRRLDARLAEAALALLEHDPVRAALVLPSWLGADPESPGATIVREWPNAHPLLGR